MSENNKNFPKKEPFNIEITQEQNEKLYEIILNHFNVVDILEKIRPQLKNSYLERSKLYFNNENNNNNNENNNINNIIKIPLEKMNEEERLLYAFICKPNISEDIPQIMFYLTTMFKRLNDPSDKKTIDNIIEISLTNYFSSKIRLYSEDANDSDEEEEKIIEKNDKKLTEEEIQKEIEELQNYPLFMTEMPKNPEKNEHLIQLQSLQYEGNFDEVSLELLNKSKNDYENYLKSKNFKDLKESMINICNAIDHSKDEKSCDYIQFSLFFQRSLLQILVKNWNYAIEDIKNAIKFIPKIKENDLKKYINDEIIDKCYFNLIESFINLNLYEKAEKIINERKNEKILINKNLIENYEKYDKKIKELKQKLIEKLNKIETFKNLKEKEKIILFDELTSKGIKLKKQIQNVPISYESKIYKDENNLFHFPILIIYDEFNITDYIQDFIENDYCDEIFNIIFKEKYLPWDKEKKYTKSNCLLYYESVNFNNNSEQIFYYPIRKDEKLIDVLTSKKIFMNGFPVFVCVCPNSQKYYQYFIEKKNILKRKN